VKHLLCTGGGTAGHVIPAIPVIERALAAGARVSFVGSRSGLEARLLEGIPVEYHGITAGKLRRYFSFENALDVFRVLAGIGQSLVLLRRLRPDAVFSKGGFVSFPVVFAAWVLRIPVVAHESDLTPGLANRLAHPFVRTLCVTFAETRARARRGRLVVTGTPVRRALVEGDAAQGRARLGIPADRPLLLVTGGSLGAGAINRAVLGALPELLGAFAVAHVCGPGKLPDVRPAGYHPFEYVGDGWGDLLAAADLVVSRAGANTLYELLALGKPSLLIPLSRKASRGDQIENAALAAARGYCRVLAEEALDAPALIEAVQAAWEDAPVMRRALAGFPSTDAAALLWDVLETVARRA
jgi:UDP-N-acetylglucosamine--N-acetylmuramyl-(pentapeptide) pyrophosphoryl-undecaprenol N-acetylglucosamine transferase